MRNEWKVASVHHLWDNCKLKTTFVLYRGKKRHKQNLSDSTEERERFAACEWGTRHTIAVIAWIICNIYLLHVNWLFVVCNKFGSKRNVCLCMCARARIRHTNRKSHSNRNHIIYRYTRCHAHCAHKFTACKLFLHGQNKPSMRNVFVSPHWLIFIFLSLSLLFWIFLCPVPKVT